MARPQHMMQQQHRGALKRLGLRLSQASTSWTSIPMMTTSLLVLPLLASAPHQGKEQTHQHPHCPRQIAASWQAPTKELHLEPQQVALIILTLWKVQRRVLTSVRRLELLPLSQVHDPGAPAHNQMSRSVRRLHLPSLRRLTRSALPSL
jgi:hypothetical protein